jgi:hypothetical protein
MARISPDPQEAFLAIFEALNWAVVIDDRLKRELPEATAWAQHFPGGDAVAGFRYARNAVHHDWSEALELEPGVLVPTPVPAMLAESMWVNYLPAGKPYGRTQYQNTSRGARSASHSKRSTIYTLTRSQCCPLSPPADERAS